MLLSVPLASNVSQSVMTPVHPTSQEDHDITYPAAIYLKVLTVS